MEKELNNILERFPEFSGKIIELFNSNGEFKSLCEDYLQCKNALVKFSDNVLKDTRIENEYKALCLDLEQEALHFFNVLR